jgi:hypothetical protein
MTFVLVSGFDLLYFFVMKNSSFDYLGFCCVELSKSNHCYDNAGESILVLPNITILEEFLNGFEDLSFGLMFVWLAGFVIVDLYSPRKCAFILFKVC